MHRMQPSDPYGLYRNQASAMWRKRTQSYKCKAITNTSLESTNSVEVMSMNTLNSGSLSSLKPSAPALFTRSSALSSSKAKRALKRTLSNSVVIVLGAKRS